MQLPLNVSSVSTSFFGLTRLGIHLVLFLACHPHCWEDGARDLAFLCLPLLLQLFALGNIEVIICFLLFSCSTYTLGSACALPNWNVESHVALI